MDKSGSFKVPRPGGIKPSAEVSSNELFSAGAKGPDPTGFTVVTPTLLESLDDTSAYVGFMTASKKPIHISSRAIAKGKMLFPVETEKPPQNSNDVIESETAEETVSAKRRKLTQPEGTSAAPDVLEDLDDLINSVLDDGEWSGSKPPSNELDSGDKDVLVESVTSLPVYKTGTGTVAAEDVGLVLSSSTSSNVDPVRLEGILSPRDGEVHLSPRDGKVHLSPCDVGFKTASGKEIRISPEALSKAKMMLQTDAVVFPEVVSEGTTFWVDSGSGKRRKLTGNDEVATELKNESDSAPMDLPDDYNDLVSCFLEDGDWSGGNPLSMETKSQSDSQEIANACMGIDDFIINSQK